MLLDSTKAPLYSLPNEEAIPARYNFKQFKWIWHDTGSKNPNKYHRDHLNNKTFSINSKEWRFMTSHRSKGCHCTYEILG